MVFVFYLLQHVIILTLMFIYQYIYFSCNEHYNMIEREGGLSIFFKKSMRLPLNVGCINIYTIVGVL
jgi:hypothetical protein